MRFKGLDLNLLAVLDVLMQERSVTGAARRLNLSQPATSSALARLREYFRDELLVPVGRTMLPTAHALSLHPIIREVLGDVERVIAASSTFDPATAIREFRIVGSDYILATLLAPLITELKGHAPNLSFWIAPPGATSALELERGDLDLLLTPRNFISPHHPAELIFEEPHVVVGWNQNPLLRSAISLDDFLASPQVVVELSPMRTKPFAEEHMDALGLARHVDVVVPSFASAPWLLPGSARLAVLHERLAKTFSTVLPLTYQPLPFPMPMMEEMAQYHSARDRDSGLQWLLQRMIDLAATGEGPSTRARRPSG